MSSLISALRPINIICSTGGLYYISENLLLSTNNKEIIIISVLETLKCLICIYMFTSTFVVNFRYLTRNRNSFSNETNIAQVLVNHVEVCNPFCIFEILKFKYYLFQILIILAVDLIYQKRNVYLLKKLLDVDKKLPNKPAYDFLKKTTITIIAIGIIIFYNKNSFYLYMYDSLKRFIFEKFYLHCIYHVQYLFTLRLLTFFYVIWERMNCINKLLEDVITKVSYKYFFQPE